MRERLQKILAQAGIASRRKAEEIISQGRVTVNGTVVTEMGSQADADRDQITVDGKPLREEKNVYVMLNKPPGVLSTAHDDRGRPTVVQMVPAHARLYPVGRLDLDSEGLLLLTNDGELTQVLTHPSYEHEKEYYVLVAAHLSGADLTALRRGVELEDGLAKVDQIEITDSQKQRTWVRLVIHEGRKRQVRRMFAALGYRLERLVRARMGPLELGKLASGEWRYLNKREIKQLKRIKYQ